MAVDLPDSVANYFRADAAHDSDRLAQCFSADGEVRDEAKLHRGRDAVGVWHRSTIEHYAATTRVLECKPRAGGAMVRGEVSGNFPGSPLVLNFDFKLGAEGIDTLEITA